ncbi:MAG: thioredoxin domain-containing protein, partial [candidate division Zixibacteria bacterium]|nr:thioredoxin domain-containing protein [candidate division Zixibacteria bacterium]
ELLNSAYQIRRQSYDSNYGGFGQAPKFPMGHNLSLLLHYWHRFNQPQSLEMVEQTLKKMAGGGIYDHLGGGFHRYSTDRFWLAPHFEKMLYDQAILSRAYLEAYQATGNEFYARVASEIFDYVLRDMTDSQGGFYSAEDADSEGKEGTFYLWKPEEIKQVLGEKNGELFCQIFDVTQAGNFEGENILHLEKPPEENLTGFISSCKEKLFQARKKRVHPHQDDKILTDWNGLMIGSLAYGYSVLGDPKYLAAAEKAADFVLKNLQKNGRLLKHYRGKAADVKGFLDDYAYFVHGLIELYQASFDPRWLKQAVGLTDSMLELFWDDENGGFYFSGKDAEKLITRTKELYDGALPSGNSLAVYNLLRLGKLTANQKYTDRAEAALKSFSGTLAQNPASYSQMLMAIDFYLGPSQEIVIAGESEREDTNKMLEKVRKQFLPRKVVILHPAGKAGQEIEKLVPYLEGLGQRDQMATAYVCRDFVCQLPTTDLAQLEQLLVQK